MRTETLFQVKIVYHENDLSKIQMQLVIIRVPYQPPLYMDIQGQNTA